VVDCWWLIFACPSEKKDIIARTLFRFPRKLPTSLSKEAEEARRPPPPDQLVGALQDPVHYEAGSCRAAKSVKCRP
jgi:hypothetical protein